MMNIVAEMEQKNVKGYLTTAEVARRFDVDPRTILRWVKAGCFPGTRKKNPRAKNSPIVIPEQSVEDFEKAQLIEPENSVRNN
ncbi:MAG: helix-turn-helix domain-containing protein [Anaerolineales bacterium]|nr:helix-turn-helix domain-containing protein [Anaerolineales bacterium]